ncbi:MAG TPA: diguanylate cyclase, partial [Burkholderiales bacterium]|nr:diguanylate cyclase [Burkholderiales bacterium]
ALNFERVSVWLYDPVRRAILCDDLYEVGPRRHSRGVELVADDFPGYFAAIEREGVISAEDAHSDLRTREFSAVYLTPNGIGAMLDAPIRTGGGLTGVLCHEHVGGPRVFHDDELNTATHLANLVALAIELRRRRESELEAKRSLSLLRAVIEASGAGLLALNADGRVYDYNQRAVEIWQLPKALLGPEAPARELMHHMAARTADPDNFIARMQAVADVPGCESQDIATLLDGRVIECTSQPQRLDDVVIGRVWSYRDVTYQHRIEAELRELSYYDPLTGLSNRRRLEEVIDLEITRARRTGQPLCVAMLDIDFFKKVNDDFGHAVGDDVLRVLASEMIQRLRATDEAGRWGGEEFVLVLSGTALDGAVQLLNELREHVGRERERLPRFTVSAGVVEYRDGQSAADLIGAADKKMYEAKNAGRNRVAA